MVSLMSGLIAILFCVRRVHLCCSDVPRKVGVVSCRDVFICRTCLSYNCLVEEKLDF